MNVEGILAQLAALVAALVLAPLLAGWVNMWRAWLQNRTAPPLTQPFRALHKLFWKESVMAHSASPLYRAAPYAVSISFALSARSRFESISVPSRSKTTSLFTAVCRE